MKMVYEFSDEQKEKLGVMTDFMLEYNSRVNLTRITDHDEIYEKHYVDSVLPTLLFDVPRGTSVIDVGTGAGFPGIPLKIVRPDLEVTLLDSLQKRVNYLQLLSKKLEIDVKAIHGRSEELAYDVQHRDKYDIGISRAMANLPALVEYVLPFVKVGGYLLAMKGERDETESAKNAISLLGGELHSAQSYSLPSGDKRMLVVVKKISQTPTNYPRKRVNITKNPL